LHVEIAISDFPTRSEPLIRRTRVRGSSGIGVRHFGVSEGRGIVTPGIAISRNAISRQFRVVGPGRCDRGTSVIAYRSSGLGRSCGSVQQKLRIPKRDFPIYPESVGSRRQRRGQVASEFGNRRFVRAVTHDRVSTDFPIG
jgi:hypothetical protein